MINKIFKSLMQHKNIINKNVIGLEQNKKNHIYQTRSNPIILWRELDTLQLIIIYIRI